MRTPVSGPVILLCILMAVPAVAAQEPADFHAADAAAIEQALQQHVRELDTDRSVVQRLLARPDVQALASEVGLDVRRAQAAVATLEGAQLAEIAAHARDVEQGLAGGQSSVRISTTLIIIALLVLILLIVAVD